MSKDRSLVESFSELNEVAKSYINAQIGLYKAIMLEKLTKIGTYFLTVILTVVVLASLALLLTLAFSFWYGEIYGTVYEGLLISAGFYAIVGIILFLLRRQIFSNNIVKNVGKTFFSDDEVDEPVK